MVLSSFISDVDVLEKSVLKHFTNFNKIYELIKENYGMFLDIYEILIVHFLLLRAWNCFKVENQDSKNQMTQLMGPLPLDLVNLRQEFADKRSTKWSLKTSLLMNNEASKKAISLCKTLAKFNRSLNLLYEETKENQIQLQMRLQRHNKNKKSVQDDNEKNNKKLEKLQTMIDDEKEKKSMKYKVMKAVKKNLTELKTTYEVALKGKKKIEDLLAGKSDKAMPQSLDHFYELSKMFTYSPALQSKKKVAVVSFRATLQTVVKKIDENIKLPPCTYQNLVDDFETLQKNDAPKNYTKAIELQLDLLINIRQLVYTFQTSCGGEEIEELIKKLDSAT